MADAGATAAAAARRKSKANALLALARQWSRDIDPASQAPYWYNATTGESRWVEPDEVAFIRELKAKRRASQGSLGGDVVASGAAGAEARLSSRTSASAGGGGDAAGAAGVARVSTAAASSAATAPRRSRAATGGSPWQEAVDPTSGDKYYYNTVTQEVDWDKPAELAAAEEAAAVSARARARSRRRSSAVRVNAEGVAVVKTAWVSGVDPDSGCEYYYNTLTGESAWEKPEDLVRAEAAAARVNNATSIWGDADAASPATDGAASDPTGGAVVEGGQDSGGSVTPGGHSSARDGDEGASGGGGAPQAAGAHAHHRHPHHRKGHKPKWKAHIDPASGDTYFVHRDTRRTTWSRPADFDGVDPRARATTTSSTTSTVSSGGGGSGGGGATGKISLKKAKAAAAAEGLAEGWIRAEHPESGKTYFFNYKTKESSWTRPPGSTNAGAPADASREGASASAGTASSSQSASAGAGLSRDPARGAAFVAEAKRKAADEEAAEAARVAAMPDADREAYLADKAAREEHEARKDSALARTMGQYGNAAAAQARPHGRSHAAGRGKGATAHAHSHAAGASGTRDRAGSLGTKGSGAAAARGAGASEVAGGVGESPVGALERKRSSTVIGLGGPADAAAAASESGGSGGRRGRGGGGGGAGGGGDGGVARTGPIEAGFVFPPEDDLPRPLPFQGGPKVYRSVTQSSVVTAHPRFELRCDDSALRDAFVRAPDNVSHVGVVIVREDGRHGPRAFKRRYVVLDNRVLMIFSGASPESPGELMSSVVVYGSRLFEVHTRQDKYRLDLLPRDMSRVVSIKCPDDAQFGKWADLLARSGAILK